MVILQLKQGNSKMGLKILTEKENPFFNRKEIEASIEADITPKKSEAEELISKKFSTNPENVKIKGIKGKCSFFSVSILSMAISCSGRAPISIAGYTSPDAVVIVSFAT